MELHRNRKRRVPTIEELYPELSPEEQREAEENLKRYAALLYHVSERLRHDPGARAQLERLMDEQDSQQHV